MAASKRGKGPAGAPDTVWGGGEGGVPPNAGSAAGRGGLGIDTEGATAGCGALVVVGAAGAAGRCGGREIGGAVGRGGGGEIDGAGATGDGLAATDAGAAAPQWEQNLAPSAIR